MHPVDSESGVRPLEGIVVVDLTQVLAGPFATQVLGDLGADVVKIEAVGRGDRSRSVSPIPEYFDTVNRNKRSVALDLKTEEGQAIAHRLLADADVFIESTKPGRTEAYDLAYETVREYNPDVIYCSISGFGHNSPYEDLPAWDMLIQAMSGVMSMTGEPDRPPVWSGLPSGDLAAAMYATQSVLGALYARERGLIDGEWIEVPMFDAALSWLSIRAGHSFGFDEPFPRDGHHHPSIAPFGTFECADGHLVVAAGTDSLWQSFCTAIDRPELADDERFVTLSDRVSHLDMLLDELQSVLLECTEAEWLERLHAHDVPAGPINDTLSVWDDEHVRRRQLHRRMERDGRDDADVIDHPVHFANLATRLDIPPQELGESTDHVLEELGYTESEISLLRERGVVE